MTAPRPNGLANPIPLDEQQRAELAEVKARIPRRGHAMLRSTRSLVIVAVAAALITACKRDQPHTPAPEALRLPTLMDANTGTYRFMDGRCRALGDLPEPWRIKPDEAFPSVINSLIELEADSAAFGIAPPAKNRRTGKDQWKVSITLGTDSILPNPYDPSTDSLWRILYGTYERPLGEPIAPRWPLPDGFKAYMHPSGSGRLLYYDPQRRMIVVDRKSDDAPNGWTSGVIWLTDREAIGFRIPYEGIARLDVLAKHFQALPEALLVLCPTAERNTNADAPSPPKETT